MATASDPMTEDEKAYFRGRMVLFGKALSVVSVVMLTLDLNCMLAGRAHTTGLSVVNTLICVAFWQFAKRTNDSPRVLQLTSEATLFSYIVILSVAHRRGLAGLVPQLTGSQVEQLTSGLLGLAQVFSMFNVMMIAILTVALRAAIVPSSRARTMRVTLLIGLPVIFISTFGVGPLEPTSRFLTDLGPREMIISVAGGSIYWAVTAFVCSMITGIVHGLRREVREARRLGQYSLQEKIGEGGMGVVYKAHHALLRRDTAIKLLSPDKAGEANLRRFEQEVRLTARLTHPNTVTVFDYGRTPDGLFYYAMEYLEGADLERIITVGGPMPTGRALKVLAELAGALEEAHGVGLIHRDIKPSNVILCQRGGEPDVAKLVDFGLVKDLAESREAEITQPDAVIGTPLYLAPEVTRSPETASESSDLYALGAVGYFLLTGRHVFEGVTLIEVLGHHMHSTPQGLGERRGEPIAADAETLILSCLAKSPTDRPASAAELREMVMACQDYGSWTAQAARTWWAEHSLQLARSTALDSPPGTRTVAIALDQRAREQALETPPLMHTRTVDDGTSRHVVNKTVAPAQ